MKVVFIINAKRHLSIEAQQTIDGVKKMNTDEVGEFYTLGPKDAIEIARNCAQERFDCIIAVGGDGTLNEVVNGIMRSDRRPILGVIPNGTGNDFFRNIGDFHPESWLEGFRKMTTKQVDLLRLDQGDNTNYGINIIGTGFDGHVIQILNRQRTKLGMKGRLSYPTAISRAFLTYKRPKLKITANNYASEGKTLLFTACNGTTFGHGLTIAPKAKIDNGVIQCVHFADLNLWDYIRYLKKLKRGEEIEHPELNYFEAREVSIEVVSGKAYCQSDGEMMQEGNCKITIIPAALKLLTTA